jgi:hypothetical protein
MKAISTVTVGTLCLLALAAHPVRADVLYNNLPGSGIRSVGADPINFPAWGPLADSFSTGAEGFTLQHVQLLLSGDNASSGGIAVSLVSGDAIKLGLPAPSSGTLIGTLADSSLTSSPSVYDFPVPSISLAPNTTYWIQVSGSNSAAAAKWYYEFDASGIGVAGEQFANTGPSFSSAGPVGFSTAGPVDFSATGPGDSPKWFLSPNSQGPYQMLLSGTISVPEPSSLIALSGLGVIGLLGCVWRRRKQTV